jgi:hypothetical protein
MVICVIVIVFVYVFDCVIVIVFVYVLVLEKDVSLKSSTITYHKKIALKSSIKSERFISIFYS